jgi:cytochrome c
VTRRIAYRYCLLPTAYCLLLTAPLAAQDRAAGGRTVWDGVYTDAQAERGRVSYQQACVACHRDDLRGDNTAPSLVGESFMFLWGEMEVGELSARIQKQMPPERPGSLPAQTYIDIVAFILQKNAFPAGDAELGPNPAAPRILITPRRPER